MSDPLKQHDTYHVPVLLEETLDALHLKKDGIYLDVTFGGGGHTTALLEREPTARVIALDWDKNALKNAEPLIEKYGDRLHLVWGNFAQLYKIAKKYKFPQFDGILADFGTSHFQIKSADGFSVHLDTPLDMRMGQGHYKTTAAHVINYATEKELCEIFWEYGEERNAKKIVAAIVEDRKKKRFKTTRELATLIERISGKKREKIHPATRVFQALRIFVNRELDNITSFLPAALSLLKPEGRLVCISFHSLEDRRVKEYFKQTVDLLQSSLVSKKVITATDEELECNPAARSAKLRAIEKK